MSDPSHRKEQENKLHSLLRWPLTRVDLLTYYYMEYFSPSNTYNFASQNRVRNTEKWK